MGRIEGESPTDEMPSRESGLTSLWSSLTREPGQPTQGATQICHRRQRLLVRPLSGSQLAASRESGPRRTVDGGPGTRLLDKYVIDNPPDANPPRLSTQTHPMNNRLSTTGEMFRSGRLALCFPLPRFNIPTSRRNVVPQNPFLGEEASQAGSPV
jgi:hypothetical protein